jgi:hypothetical protein
MPLVSIEPTDVEPFPEHLEEELNTYFLRTTIAAPV